MRKLEKLAGWAALGLLGLTVLQGLGLGNRSPNYSEKEAFALSFYRDIDAGRYDRITEHYIEPRWSDEDDSLSISNWLSRDELYDQLYDDFGHRGWRIRVVSLEVIDSWPTEVDALTENFPRIADAARSLGIEQVHIVEISGSVTGRCAIDNWHKTLPLIVKDGRVMILSAGLPDDLILLHPEHFMKDIDF